VTLDCYQVKVFGLSRRYIESIDVKSITKKIYDEETAWQKARSIIRAAERENLSPQVFVTKCSAEVTPEYDIPVMDPEE